MYYLGPVYIDIDLDEDFETEWLSLSVFCTQRVLVYLVVSNIIEFIGWEWILMHSVFMS